MQPNNEQFPSDYLNSIATAPPVKTMNPLFLWAMIAGVLIVAIVAVVWVTSSSSGGSTTSLTSIGAKLASLKDVSEKAQKDVQSSELRTLNSSLTLVLTNANRDITAPLAERDIKLKDEKKNSAVVTVTKEIGTLSSRLEDARLNAVYDRTYAREIAYAIKTLRSEMSILYDASSSDKLKKVLSDTDANLAPLLEGFDTFNAA